VVCACGFGFSVIAPLLGGTGLGWLDHHPKIIGELKGSSIFKILKKNIIK